MTITAIGARHELNGMTISFPEKKVIDFDVDDTDDACYVEDYEDEEKPIPDHVQRITLPR